MKTSSLFISPQVALSNPKELAGLMCAAAAAAAALFKHRLRDSAAYEKHVEASSH
jgi:hypothetical protein